MEKNVEKSRMRRNDLILLLVLLAVAALAFVGWKLAHKSPGDSLIIEVDGKVAYEYALSKDGVYEIKGFRNGTNTLTVKNGSAQITDSTCPDHLCESQGSIVKDGEMIVCLPNRVIIRVESSTGSDADIQIR